MDISLAVFWNIIVVMQNFGEKKQQQTNMFLEKKFL